LHAMAAVHGSLSILAAVALVAMLAVAAATWAGAMRTHRWLDRSILAQAVSAALAAAAGVLVAIASGRLPTDPLHVVYGAVLVVGPVTGRYAARTQSSVRLGRSMTLIGVLAMGILVRALLTAG
jgi:hypothetical protein